MRQRDSRYVAVLMDSHPELIRFARFEVDDVAAYPTKVWVSDPVKHGRYPRIIIKVQF